MTDDRNHKRSWAAPLLVAARMLLPLVYIGSYAAVVTAGGFVYIKTDHSGYRTYLPDSHRFGDEWAGRAYWPLEGADRSCFPSGGNIESAGKGKTDARKATC